eukprot:1332936-Amphidinium_carterae.1
MLCSISSDFAARVLGGGGLVPARVGTGAELDGDSLIFSGMDNMFEPTRREVTPEYPFPILP